MKRTTKKQQIADAINAYVVASQFVEAINHGAEYGKELWQAERFRKILELRALGIPVLEDHDDVVGISSEFLKAEIERLDKKRRVDAGRALVTDLNPNL